MITDKVIGICSFADMRLYQSLERFKRMALSMDVIDIVAVYSELDLPKEYLNKNRKLLTTNSRGFGYWCWKPFIVLNELKKNPDMDILFYCDSGSHIRGGGVERLFEYVQLLSESKHDILAFHLSLETSHPFDELNSNIQGNGMLEAHWTKGDMFNHFGINEKHPHAWTPQVAGGLFAVKNTHRIRSFLQDWTKDLENFPHLFNDVPSTIPNFNGFIEHRHDQSYFSLSLKQLGYVKLSAWENDPFCLLHWGNVKLSAWEIDSPDLIWDRLDLAPFHHRRDKKRSKFWRLVKLSRKLLNLRKGHFN